MQNYLHVAFVGDSTAVLCRGSRAQCLCPELHRPTNPSEKRRIEAAGGKVSSGRVFGLLSVSRSFGDTGFKTSRGEFAKQFSGDLVSCVPCIVSRKISANDEFLILASDGLFDVMSHQAAVDSIRVALKEGTSLDAAVENVVDKSIDDLSSLDNVSALVVCMRG